MLKTSLLPILAVVVSLSTACSAQSPASKTDDPSVYVAAVDLLFDRDTAGGRVVLVDEVLAVDSSAIESAIASMPIRDSTARNFTPNSIQLGRVPPAEEIQARTATVAMIASQATMERLRAQAESDQHNDPQRFPTPTEPYWDHVHREFAPAKTLVRLSPAAYSRDGKHAILYVTYSCGGLCGGSYWIAFDRSGSKWALRHVLQGSVS